MPPRLYLPLLGLIAAGLWLARSDRASPDVNLGPAASKSAPGPAPVQPGAENTPPPRAEPAPTDFHATAEKLVELIRAERFTDALALAENADDAQAREEWLSIVFASWARARPEDAPALAELLHRHAAGAKAFNAFASAWAESSPGAVARFAVTLPAGADRDAALSVAVERWILLSPGEAAEWIAGLTDPGEFDRAAGLLVERTDPLARPTSTALEWARNLADPELRLRALTHVLREWAERDRAAARSYVESAPDLPPAHRKALLATLTPPVAED